MNKIFISDRPLYLNCENEPQSLGCEHNHTYSSQKELKKAIEHFELHPEINCMSIHFDSEKQIQKTFHSLYRGIEAAGGIVKNSKGQLLFIFRHGKWDLPKGKIEKGEGEEEAALREVEEECGISDLSIESKFCATYHTYELKGEAVLKTSHWYLMNYSGNTSNLIPQTEEGITDAKWLSKAEIDEAMNNTYASIAEVMRLYYSTEIKK